MAMSDKRGLLMIVKANAAFVSYCTARAAVGHIATLLQKYGDDPAFSSRLKELAVTDDLKRYARLVDRRKT